MGIHNLAPVLSALKLGAPTSVNASSTLVNDETLPLASTVHYEFPARGDMPPVTLHWYDGGIIPPRPPELEDDRELSREDGLIFVGDKGKMLVEGWGGNSPAPDPGIEDAGLQAAAEDLAPLHRPPRRVDQGLQGGHAHAVELRDFAGPLTEAVLLGTVCVRMGGGKLLWDSENLKVTNVPEANKYLHYEYRKGWSL